MLYPDKFPIDCVLGTPAEYIIRAVNDISEALSVALGHDGENDLPNYSSRAIYKNMVASEHNINWYVHYWADAVRALLLSNKEHEKSFSKLTSIFLSKWSLDELYVVAGFVGYDIDEFCIDDNPFYDDEEDYGSSQFDKSSDMITVSRAFIANKGFTYDDFLFGTPAWLNQTRPVVLETYDQESRRHIKITNDGKRLHYYTSIISDNFKEISNVPPEMDAIVSYLLTTRGDLALANGRQVDDFI